MASTKKRNVYRGLIVWMLLMLALALLAAAGYVYTKNALIRRETAHQEEVEKTNQERVAAYNAATAELQKQLATLTQGEQEWPAAKTQGWDVLDLTSFGVKNGTQKTVTRADLLGGGLLLINRWHAMPADLTDDLMVSVNRYSRADEDKTNNLPTKNASISLQTTAVEALMRLYQDARAQGLDMDNIVIGQGYRTMEEQSTYWNSKVAEYEGRYSGTELDERVRRTTAYPGTSDYQAGFSVELYNYKSGDAAFSNTPLHQTEQGQWIYENAWKYGFVFRFPVQGFPYPETADKSYKTGINMEMKVYRYVGEANAAAMQALDMCLEEYIEYLLQHPHIAVYKDGKLLYEIYRQTNGNSAGNTSITVPYGAASYSVSTDNMDGVVVCIAY